MSRQITSQALMIRPANFGFNEETAANNAFQKKDDRWTAAEVQQKALEEFDAFALKLMQAGVDVMVAEDDIAPVKPDAIFPNNWVSFHDDGSIITYPMFSSLRRQERNPEILRVIESHYAVQKHIHLEKYEDGHKFLEGTGSMVLDRVNKISYACSGPRTDEEALDHFCRIMDYKKMLFDAFDARGQKIYHTNVMMALGKSLAVICLQAITDKRQREMLIEELEATEKEIIEISHKQMDHFAGNMLQMNSNDGKSFLIMSKQARESLNDRQIEQIHRHTRILSADLQTIETFGGGSARCMIAEIFITKRK